MTGINLDLVNRFVLHKQHLADDSKTDDIVRIVKDVSGLHATSPRTPYLSLFSRAENFRRDMLDEELYVKGRLGKVRCMRKTVYILRKALVPMALSATRMMVEPYI